MKKWLAILLGSLSAIALWFWWQPKPPLLTGINYSQAIFSDDQKLLHLTLSSDQQYRLYTPLNQLAPHVIDAILLQEDRYFYWHMGVNPIALIKAFWTTYVAHTRRRGGSTITMQVARLRYHLQTKTIKGKLTQIYYALLLERYYTKQEILQAYVNLAPFGGNIQGVGAASLIYFHTKPKHVTLTQALTLAVIPQNPTQRRLNYRQNNRILLAARSRLFQAWQQAHALTVEQQAAFQLPLEFYTLSQLPLRAPHFVNFILQNDREHHWIHSTLNLSLQAILKQQIQAFIKQHQIQGVRNAAAVLIDARTMAIKAMQGSADFFNTEIQGQVNGTTAQRSPGSTLKPFIYALAIQQGLIIPKSIVFDLPKTFGHYTPENIDNQYEGPITAEKALILSRNIPAVDLEQKLGQEHDLYHLLQQAGIKSLRSRDDYGLSLALGGGELSMLTLVELYTSLINQGKLKSLRFADYQPLELGKTLLTPEASFITLQMLQQQTALHAINSAAWEKKPIKIAWKTGTSSGNRDAWAIGIFGPYVLAVWVGDFRAHANPYFIGQEIAAPLFFNIVQAVITTPQFKLDINKHLVNTRLKLNVKKVNVCAASGMLPGKFCSQLTSSWFIPGVSPIKQDNVFQQVFIDNQTGLRACEQRRNIHSEVYEIWPSDVQQYFLTVGIKHKLAPPFMPDCYQYISTQQASVNIISPPNNQVYVLTKKTMQLPLLATTGIPHQRLYWFVDNNFLGVGSPDKAVYWHVTPGKHQVMVLTNLGYAAVNAVLVK
ncbi:MAG: penicillin-binding protein 1C [Gammaproteobacteria bacterium]